tara:strand:+ start:59 stop:292 length:234 start_codon:yes stop_codon:yes gene_type:complete
MPEHLRLRQLRAPVAYLPRSAQAKVAALPLAVLVLGVLGVLGEVQAAAAALRAEAVRGAGAAGRPCAQQSEVVAAAC